MEFFILEAALALHYMHYNFCRVHKTLDTTQRVAPSGGETIGRGPSC